MTRSFADLMEALTDWKRSQRLEKSVHAFLRRKVKQRRAVISLTEATENLIKRHPELDPQDASSIAERAFKSFKPGRWKGHF